MDITAKFIEARGRGLWQDDERQAFADVLKKAFGCDIDWNPDAGEEWMAMRTDEGFAGIVHGQVKIAFLAKPERDLGADAEIIWADSFEEAAYSIDPEAIAEKCPELGWHAVPEAVDAAKFSLKDMYFATL